ncbi:MAG: energy transducer TonB [Bacteroidaceae bacterium]|nr:energy transducer TonB [Bacteroidaceae bacterium]
MRVLMMLAIVAVCNCIPAIAQNAYADNDSTDVDTVDVIVQPEYDGGMSKLYDYVTENFIYPDECERRHVSGTVEVKFTIEKSGDVSAVSILKGIDETIDEELVRIFRAMPAWIPATRNGEPVRYIVSMPITLKLSRVNKNGFR